MTPQLTEQRITIRITTMTCQSKVAVSSNSTMINNLRTTKNHQTHHELLLAINQVFNLRGTHPITKNSQGKLKH